MLSTTDITPFLLYKLRDAPAYVAVSILLAPVLYTLGLAAYNLFFHPLRKVPGPWIAAASYWYEFYQDVVLDGNYIKEYPKLHEKYGMWPSTSSDMPPLALI